MKTSEKRKQLRRKWRSYIEDYDSSSQTQIQYTEDKGISIAQFKYWRRVLGRPTMSTNSEDSFVPVRISTEKDKSIINEIDYCTITFENGGVIGIKNKAGMSKIAELLGMMR